MSEAISPKRFEPVSEKSKSGQKFTIRQAEFSELPAIFRHISNNSDSKSKFHRTVSESFLEKFAGFLNEGKFPKNYFLLVAEHPETKEILGVSDAGFIPDRKEGFCRDAISFRKRDGIGEKLLFHKTNHLFRNLKAKIVTATVRKANKPSMKNALKLGFLKKGDFSNEILLEAERKKFLRLNFKS